MMQAVPIKVDPNNVTETTGKIIMFWFCRIYSIPYTNTHDTYIHFRVPDSYWSESGKHYETLASVFYKIKK